MRQGLILLLLFVACFSQATFMKVHSVLRERSGGEGGVMALLFGDSRRIFSNHFFSKAEVYFKKGVSTSIFDDKSKRAGESANPSEPSGNWIQRFGNNFRPVRPADLGNTNDVREMMPWLYLSVEVDPHNIQTYLVAALYLRKSLGRFDEAERLLRIGLAENSKSYELLLEMGQLYHDRGNQTERARNLWKRAAQCWQEREASRPDPDVLAYAQIAVRLARLEEDARNFATAIKWLEEAGRVTGKPERFREQIEALRAKASELPHQ